MPLLWYYIEVKIYEVIDMILKDKDIITEGLSSAEAARLAAEGKANVTKERAGKSYLRIVTDNLFTFFNLIWALLAVVVIICQSYTNLTFLIVVTLNTVIAIVQEIKAKRTVERLSVTTDPRACVLRDGELIEIAATELVLGDLMYVEMGRQVLSDAVVVSGVAEANESLLTGEADAIKKTEGERLLAGSYLVSGAVYARVTAVGADNYVHKIEKAAKSFKPAFSNLFRDLTRLIRAIAIFMIPFTPIMMTVNYFAYGKDLVTAAIKTVGSLSAMIPAGMYLLVTLTLTLSVIKLARKRTLVQDMYSIEMLASADVLCLDKTGTITDGTMEVVSYKILDGTSDESFRKIMAQIEGSESTLNNTSRALLSYFGKSSDANVTEKLPFSSERKYSAVEFEGVGAFSLGAPHFVPCPVSEELDGEIALHAARGERVILLSRSEAIGEEGVPLAIIAISDRIRPAAREIIASFQEQGVTLKVISGDHAATVSTIATLVGIKDADKYISCEGLTDGELEAAAECYAVFGRVTPEQKVTLVKALKKAGHTVAMTGDGVNDTLALKESNCAIAMADGSEVARKVSQIVLMNSDFATLPDVVAEGRRCINNVRQSASLFLMKTFFTILVATMAIITVKGFPFSSNQTALLELFIIGVASFALALEPNNKRIEGSFLKTVIVKSVPNALAMFIPVMVLFILEGPLGISVDCRNSIAMAVMTTVGFANLAAICIPYSGWRALVVGVVGGCLAIAVPVSIFALGDMFGFGYVAENYTLFFITLFAAVAFAALLHAVRIIITRRK